MDDAESTLAKPPRPQAVLKLQIKQLVYHQNQSGVIYTRDLLDLIDKYEQQQNVVLLTPEQKTAIRPYCLANPDLEMTPDDVLSLINLVFPSSSSSSAQEEVRPRTSAPLTDQKKQRRRSSTASSKRRLSVASAVQDDEDKPTTDDIRTEGDDDDVDQNNMAQYYRRSIQLTRRLKMSERNLASMTRDNEDRIVQLQSKVDDMNQEVVKQRREIMEYKNKEKNSLEQISALEAHIARIERSETDQKQVYQSIRRLFDEKCKEAQELQEMLRHKELELQRTEALLSSIHHEFKQLHEERNRLMELQNELERELASSRSTHLQLAEQRSENERLKEIIDSLKYEMEARSGDDDVNGVVLPETTNETHHLMNTLRAELESHVNDADEDFRMPDASLDTEKRLKSVENEKDYYKSRATEAMEDLDRVKKELNHLKRALQYENQSLVSELADLRMKMPDYGENAIQQLALGHAEAMDMVEPCVLPAQPGDATAIQIGYPSNDIWIQPKLRQRKMDKAKKRGVQDLNESTAYMASSSIMQPDTPTQTVARSNDRAVTNTTTFAIYTLLVYIFGIVTSTFLLENGHAGSWEQALVAAATQSGGSRSKILEILIYWIEKLLFEGQGVPMT